MPLLTNVQVTVASAPGTGSITLGAGATNAQAQAAPAASTPSLSWSAAGAVDGALYSYRIEGAAGWEIGIGTYAASGPTLARTTILFSSNGGSAVTFGADAIVSQVALPADIAGSGGITAAQARAIARRQALRYSTR